MSRQAAPPPKPAPGTFHPMTHIFPSVIPSNEIPLHFAPNHTPFDPSQLPPLPRILNPQLNEAARDCRHSDQVPNVMELALLGDTVLKTIILERLQDLAQCGKSGQIANITMRLNTNIVFCYLSMAYNMLIRKTREQPHQKAYADVFEAYIGALWRESNDFGKACVRLVVREIFSPRVFPIIADWQAGKREFGVVRAVKEKKIRYKLREQAVAVHRGVSKALAIGGAALGGKRKTPSWATSGDHRSGRPSEPPRRPQVIDLTLDEDDEEADDSDDESIVYISESEWVEMNVAPSRRLPSVFIDAEPSFPYGDERSDQSAAGPSGTSGTSFAESDENAGETASAGPSRGRRAEVTYISDDDDYGHLPTAGPRRSGTPTIYIDTEPLSLSDDGYFDPPLKADHSVPTKNTPPSRSPAPSSDISLPFPSDPHSTGGPFIRSHLQATVDTPHKSHPPSTETPHRTPRQFFASPWADNEQPDWHAIMSSQKPASAIPAMVRQPIERHSPLRKLGDAIGSVKNKVEAAFKRKEVKERARRSCDKGDPATDLA